MAKIEGLNSLKSKLRERAEKAGRPVSVVVGYTAAYAIYVHENLEAHHTVGNAKFLEGPARRLSPEIGEIARRVYQQTGDLGQGLMVAGLRLQRESMLEVPVDTGNLRASAFTEKE